MIGRNVNSRENCDKTNTVYESGTVWKTAMVTRGHSQYEWWWTALKPAHENWLLLKKPIEESTIAKNVLKWGTGGINIDTSRVEWAMDHWNWGGNQKNSQSILGNGGKEYRTVPNELWRFPANLIQDGSQTVLDIFPDSKWWAFPKSHGGSLFTSATEREARLEMDEWWSASRFFYCTKPSKAEKNSWVLNSHPTVKSQRLMSYLVNMITPKGGTVLDPFAWSFSTLVACQNLWYNWIWIEKEEEYYNIGVSRINHITQ